MVAAQASLTGWWVGYAIGVPVVLVVAVLLIIITASVHRIAAVAEDATRSLRETRERTEALWTLEATTGAVREIRDGASEARRSLGG